MSHRCFKEGCENRAPHGFRLPGQMSRLPEKFRWKYLWACDDHIEEAQARRDKKADEVML